MYHFKEISFSIFSFEFDLALRGVPIPGGGVIPNFECEFRILFVRARLSCPDFFCIHPQNCKRFTALCLKRLKRLNASKFENQLKRGRSLRHDAALAALSHATGGVMASASKMRWERCHCGGEGICADCN